MKPPKYVWNPHIVYLIITNNRISRFYPILRTELNIIQRFRGSSSYLSRSGLSGKKLQPRWHHEMWNPSAFHSCFIGILITLGYNPYYPLYNPTNQGFSHCSHKVLYADFAFSFIQRHCLKKTVQSNLRVGTTVHSSMCIFFHLLLASVSICLSYQTTSTQKY